MNKVCLSCALAIAAATLSIAAPGLAQPAAGGTATATTGGTATGGMGLPGGQAQAVAGSSDHDMMVGTFAIGYLGRRTLAYGGGTALTTGAPVRAVVQAPVIGARYWIAPLLGIDAGIGLAIVDDGKIETESTVGGVPNPAGDADLAPVTGFLFHAGVPLALSNAGHFSFQVIPEFNIGFATQTVQPAPNVENKGTGFTADIGARGGAEIHFGFIGVPQLSLQGSIGLLYRFERWSVESTSPAETGKHTETRGNFSTTVYDNPWNIFTSNVAALYYF